METVERNTSKQVSANETALWSVYKYSRIIFFFWSKVNVEKQSRGNGMKVIQGCNGPGLDGYLRWKSFSNSLAYSSSITGNHSESLSVSLYPSHITLYSSLHALWQSILELTILEISYSGSLSMITGAGRGSEAVGNCLVWLVRAWRQGIQDEQPLWYPEGGEWTIVDWAGQLSRMV